MLMDMVQLLYISLPQSTPHIPSPPRLHKLPYHSFPVPLHRVSHSQPQTYIKYSIDFLRPIKTAEAFEAVDWLADLPQQTWPQAGHQ